MDITQIGSLLLKYGEIYLLDDFEEIAVRLTLSEGCTIAHLKHKGNGEVPISQSEKVVFDVKLGGELISKEVYEAY
ncbi:MAG: hypothetical protein LKF31_00970 [Muribaculaceae bacterium]|jgi:hypothetical protein|nr:hypothetical protein [Muribaculaceae bacterium]